MNEDKSIRVALSTLPKSGNDRLVFAIGTNADSITVTDSVTNLQHLVICGFPGAGKSTLVHCMIVSLLETVSQDNVKFFLIDSRGVEYSCYRGLDNVFLPNEPGVRNAENAIRIIGEGVYNRLKKLSESGCKSIDDYNSRQWEEFREELPRIILVLDGVDSFLNSSETKSQLERILLNGRTVGIHLVAVANDSSNKNVSKLIQSFPSRVSFRVKSKEESMLLIDSAKAENIQGIGLFILNSPFKKTDEIITCYKVFQDDISHAKMSAADHKTKKSNEYRMYIHSMAALGNTSGLKEPDEEPEGDEILPAAVDVILETGQASVSMLQRRLKLGYARAAQLVEEMEKKGIVGPFQGSKPRDILVTKEEWADRRGDMEDKYSEISECDAPEKPQIENDAAKENNKQSNSLHTEPENNDFDENEGEEIMEEKILAECRKHWIGMVIPVAFGAIPAIGGISFLFSGMFIDALISLAIAAIIITPSAIRTETDYLRLTSTKIVGHVGFIRSRKQVSPIGKVQDVSIESGLLGKIFGYCTITVSTAGKFNCEYVYKKMANADAFQQAFANVENTRV